VSHQPHGDIYQEYPKYENCCFNEKVNDWEQRIANYTPAIKARYQYAFKKMQEFSDAYHDKSTGWVSVANDKKAKLTAEWKMQDGLPCMRGKCFMDHDSITVFRAYVNSEMTPKYDPTINCRKVVKHLGANLTQVYARSNRIVVVSPRDFYFDVFYNIMENNTVIVAMYDSQEEYPVENGIVRGSFPVSGLIIRPLPENKNKCSIEFFVACDFKMPNIPSFVVQVAMKQEAYAFAKVNKIIPEYKKKYASD